MLPSRYPKRPESQTKPKPKASRSCKRPGENPLGGTLTKCLANVSPGIHKEALEDKENN